MIPSGTRAPFWHRTAAGLGIFLAMLGVMLAIYARSFRDPVFGSEDSWFYLANAKHTFRNILDQYGMLDSNWYRPTQFYLSYWVASRFLAWDDHLGFKISNFMLWALLGVCMRWFTLRLFPGRHLAGFLAFVFFAGHPVVFNSAFETAQYDALHMIFCVLTAGLYARFRDGGKRAWIAYGASLAGFVTALTCKEPAILLPVLLVCLDPWLGGPDADPAPSFRSRVLSGLKRTVPFWAVLAVYGALRFEGLFLHPLHNTPEAVYPTVIAPKKILDNLATGPLWTVRLFGASTAYADGMTCLLGILVLGLVATYSFRNRRALLLWGWISVFLSMPVYSGGMYHHFALPALGYAILAALAVERALERLPWRPAVPVGGILVAAILVWSGRENFRSYIESRSHYDVHRAAMNRPPVPRDRIPDGSYVLVDDAPGYGFSIYCYGQLFQFVYQRTLYEEMYQQATPEFLVRWIGSPSRFAFRYEPEGKRFLDVTSEMELRIGARLQDGARGDGR